MSKAEASLDGKGRAAYSVLGTGGRVKAITASPMGAGLAGLDHADVSWRLAGVNFRTGRPGTRAKVAGSQPRSGSLWVL